MPLGRTQPSGTFVCQLPSGGTPGIFYCLFYHHCLCRFGYIFCCSSTIICFESSCQCRLIVCIVVLIQFLSNAIQTWPNGSFDCKKGKTEQQSKYQCALQKWDATIQYANHYSKALCIKKSTTTYYLGPYEYKLSCNLSPAPERRAILITTDGRKFCPGKNHST